MSAASWGSLTSQGSLPRAGKSSTQRSPERASCCPVATVSRQKPKRRSAARGLPPQRASATSAWKSRRWWPLSRRAAERIRSSYNFTEASIAVPPEVGGITTLGLGLWPVGYRVGFHSPDALEVGLVEIEASTKRWIRLFTLTMKRYGFRPASRDLLSQRPDL